MSTAHFERVPNLPEVSHIEVACYQRVPSLWDTGTLGTEGFNRFSPGRGCACVRPRVRTRIHLKHSVPSVPSVPFQSKKPGTLYGTLALFRPLVSHRCGKGGCLHA